MIRRLLFLSLLVAVLVTGTRSFAGDTLDAIYLRDEVVCGVSTGLLGFSLIDGKTGEWTGIDVDICRAVAAAVLGDADKVSFVPLTAAERFEALQTGEIDLLVRNSTWTFRRDTEMDLTFVGVNYYDGQGFLVKRSLGVKNLADLNNASVCVLEGTTTVESLKSYFESKKMTYTPVLLATSEQTASAFESGRCNVITTDQSALFGLQKRMENPEESIILPEVITKEPLGAVVRSDDKEWLKIVQWTLYALLNAEELGVTSKNAAQLRRSKNQDIQWLLGSRGDLGRQIGLSYHWAFDAVRQVGNYGEIFERNVGMESSLKIKRGLNALWKDGGIMYAPPIR